MGVSRFLCIAIVLPAALGHPADAASLRTESDLVLVPVTVTDRTGAAVLGLARNLFRVQDEGEPRAIVSFEREPAPASIVLVVDLSASMRSKVGPAREALRRILALSNPQDEAALFTFGDRPQLRRGFTRDMEQLVQSLDGAQPAGQTALIDGVWRGLETARQGRHSRRALIVISDGGDNYSRHRESELVDFAVEADTQTYSVLVHSRSFSMEERSGSELLERLARETGGLHFEVRNVKELPEAAEKIGDALRNLYVIGFKPAKGACRKGRHRIRVSLDNAAGRNLRISARTAYTSSQSQ
ncbi:MAG: VWA domain-containing protein [Bryobacteraceae bacterium]